MYNINASQAKNINKAVVFASFYLFYAGGILVGRKKVSRICFDKMLDEGSWSRCINGSIITLAAAQMGNMSNFW